MLFLFVFCKQVAMRGSKVTFFTWQNLPFLVNMINVVLEVENVSCDVATLITLYILDLGVDGLHVLSQQIRTRASVFT